MTWVTWRQHRLEGVWALVLAGLTAAAIGFVASEMHMASCGTTGYQGGVRYCLPADALGQAADLLIAAHLFNYGLVVLPALAGAFIAAPLVAREAENGTHRLAWTQGVTRLRWLLVKVTLVFTPLVLAAATVGLLEVVLINVEAAHPNRYAFFDQQAPMTAASTALALAIGLLAGALIRRSIPAMAATLVAFVVVRIGIAELARPRYMTAVTLRAQDPAGLNFQSQPTAWWLDREPQWQDSAGHALSQAQVAASGGSVSYIQQHGWWLVEQVQPGDRFWAFQAIESAILFGLAAAMLAIAVYWTVRRVS